MRKNSKHVFLISILSVGMFVTACMSNKKCNQYHSYKRHLIKNQIVSTNKTIYWLRRKPVCILIFNRLYATISIGLSCDPVWSILFNIGIVFGVEMRSLHIVFRYSLCFHWTLTVIYFVSLWTKKLFVQYSGVLVKPAVSDTELSIS